VGGSLGSGARSIAIGGESGGETTLASGANSLAIGGGTWATGAGSTAIGDFAYAPAANSVALGANSSASRANTVSVGNTAAGGQRQVVNVAAGTQANDAVNKAPPDAVAAAGALPSQYFTATRAGPRTAPNPATFPTTSCSEAPGRNTSLTPIFRSSGMSWAGMIPPTKTFTSSIPFAFRSRTIFWQIGRCAPERIEMPTASPVLRGLAWVSAIRKDQTADRGQAEFLIFQWVQRTTLERWYPQLLRAGAQG